MAVQPVAISPALARIISAAGDKSGVDFDYLVQTAMRESSLDPQARASTSSATGLFQFIESTWFETLKIDGPRLGYGDLAAQITQTADGEFDIADPAVRRRVLALREDAQMSADLAAAFTRRNGAYLYERFGRQPSPGELYIAHFLGARGAEKLFEAGLQNPDHIAATIFPRQAEANRGIFFDGGRALSVREVYLSLVSRHTGPGSSAVQPVTLAASGPAPRIGQPQDFSFTEMYAPVHPQTQSGVVPPIPAPPRGSGQRFVVVDPGAALFVQLYGR